MGFNDAPANHPPRNAMDLSHNLKTTMDMGALVPVFKKLMYPGDTFKIGVQSLIRMQPLVAPVMHDIAAQIHYFFVPLRLIQGYDPKNGIQLPNTPVENREHYIDEILDGGDTGDEIYEFPTWDNDVPVGDPNRGVGSLWDYFKYPVATPNNPSNYFWSIPACAWDKRAYNRIWNEYYRDVNLQDMVNLDSEELLYRNWRKDYFTSALPWLQRGTPPGLDITPNAEFVEWLQDNIGVGQWPNANERSFNFSSLAASPDSAGLDFQTGDDGGTGDPASANHARQFFNNMITTALSNSGILVSELRDSFSIQRFLELQGQAGTSRLKSWIMANFGVTVSDSRLQRPEYVGGVTMPLIISEVLQTSSSDSVSPQGEMAGHGITSSDGFVGNYFSEEHGIMIGVMSIMPKGVYFNGVNREDIYTNMYDLYNPAFANLSEQLIYRAELRVIPRENGVWNKTAFGYQGRYDEARIIPSTVTGNMRNDFRFWHLGRFFSADAPPALNEEFISTKDTIRKDIFAFNADTPEAHGFIVELQHMVKAIRPMPLNPRPGLADHVYGGL